MANFEKASVGEKIAGYVDSRKKILIALVVVVVVAIAAFALFTGITSSAAKKGLSAIDKISYTLTENSSDLSDEALQTSWESRRQACGCTSRWHPEDILQSPWCRTWCRWRIRRRCRSARG